jgi:outer membrane protein W
MTNFGYGLQRKFQISLFAGMNHVFEYGSENDYIPGTNDFPVTPTHSPLSFGAAFALFFTNYLGVELDGMYVPSSKVTLVDPSDLDRVNVDSSKHYSLTLNVIYRFLKGNFRPYLGVGGGIDKLMAKYYEVLTSEYGNEITFIPPEKTTSLIAQVRAGIHYSLSKRLGLLMDIRYAVIFDDPNNVNSVDLIFGAFLKF